MASPLMPFQSFRMMVRNWSSPPTATTAVDAIRIYSLPSGKINMIIELFSPDSLGTNRTPVPYKKRSVVYFLKLSVNVLMDKLSVNDFKS